MAKITNVASTGTAPIPAPAPVSDSPIKPAYWCGLATCEQYSNDALHNPLGIPGSIYGSPNGALCLYNKSMGGRIPLQLFQRGDTVILHFVEGVINGLSRMDAGRFLYPGWRDSLLELISLLIRRGVTVLVYLGTMQDGPDAIAAGKVLMDWAKLALVYRFGIIPDAAAIAKAEPFVNELTGAAQSLFFDGLTFGVEGMWSKKMYDALNRYTGVHVIERGTVEASFTNSGDPGWAKVVTPDPSKVLIWDNKKPVADWSTPEAAKLLGQVGPAFVNASTSAIGAETWRIGTLNNPRLAVSRQDVAARTLLGVAEAVPQ